MFILFLQKYQPYNFLINGLAYFRTVLKTYSCWKGKRKMNIDVKKKKKPTTHHVPSFQLSRLSKCTKYTEQTKNPIFPGKILYTKMEKYNIMSKCPIQDLDPKINLTLGFICGSH